MKCISCGKDQDDGGRFCINCGFELGTGAGSGVTQDKVPPAGEPAGPIPQKERRIFTARTLGMAGLPAEVVLQSGFVPGLNLDSFPGGTGGRGGDLDFRKDACEGYFLPFLAGWAFLTRGKRDAIWKQESAKILLEHLILESFGIGALPQALAVDIYKYATREKRFERMKANPNSFVIADPNVVGTEFKAQAKTKFWQDVRSAVVITAEDEEGNREQYWFSPGLEGKHGEASALWLVESAWMSRCRYEFGFFQ